MYCKGINIWFNVQGACRMNLLELWVLQMKMAESGQSGNDPAWYNPEKTVFGIAL